MKHTFHLTLSLALLAAIASPADAQEQIPVRDTTNLGTRFQGWYQCKNYKLKARITIRGVERKQLFEVTIPNGRKVAGIDIVETSAAPVGEPETTPDRTNRPRPRDGINRLLDPANSGSSSGSTDGDKSDGDTVMPTFKDSKNFRLVPILEGDAYTTEIVNADGTALDLETEWLVGHKFDVKAALFAKDDPEHETPVTLEGATFRWGVEGQQLKSYTVNVGKYKGEDINFFHGRPDKDDAYERYRYIVTVQNTPLSFGVQSTPLSLAHLTAPELSLWWQTEGSGARRVTLRADVEIDGFKERYSKEVMIKVRRTDNPARHIFTYEGRQGLPGGIDVLPNHSGWHYAYRGTDKFIFFHREFLRFYNNFRELFGYMRLQEELDPEGYAFGEDLANYTYLTREGGEESSSQHGAKKLADFDTISELGDDLESPFHNRGHGTISRNPGCGDLASVQKAPNNEEFFMWHTKVDNIALDYQDLKEAEVLRADAEAAETELTKTLQPDPDAEAFEDLSGTWNLKGKGANGAEFSAIAGITKTGKNVYSIHGKGQLASGARFTYSASGRRNSETEFEVLHSTDGRGLAGRLLPDVDAVPAITAKYTIDGYKSFGGSFTVGSDAGSATYTRRKNPTITFDPPTVTIRSGQRLTITATADPVETMEMLWITDTGFLITGGVKKNRRAGAKRVTIEGQAPGEYELLALLNRGGAVLAKTTITVLPNLATDLVSRIEAAKAAGKEPIVVFDVDNTLFDSRARTLGLLQMWVEQNGAGEESDKLTSGTIDQMRNDVFRTLGSLRYRGADRAAIKSFVDTRFDDGQHFHLDTLVEGALGQVKKAKDAGATIVYLSERSDALRAATTQQLWGPGFPQGELIMMERSGSVSKWKKEQVKTLAERGTIVGIFDNEPRHANAMSEAAPSGTVFRMDTVAKPNSPKLAAGVETIGTFR